MTNWFAAYATNQLWSIFCMQMVFVARDTSMHHIIRGRVSPPDDADVRRAVRKIMHFWVTGHYRIAKVVALT